MLTCNLKSILIIALLYPLLELSSDVILLEHHTNQVLRPKGPAGIMLPEWKNKTG